MHKNSYRFFIFGLVVIWHMGSVPAFAHLGHFGELAGHSHVAGAVLGGLAIGLAGILAAQNKRSKDRDMKTADTDAGDEGADDGFDRPEANEGVEQNA